METQDRLISFLKEEKILSEEALGAVIEQQQETGQSLISVLRKQNLLDEEQFTRAIASTNKIEFVNLSPEQVDPMVAHLVSHEIAQSHNIIPIRKEDNKLVVAMSSPLNLSVQDQIEMKTGYEVIPVAAMPSAIKEAIHYHFNVTNVTKQAIVSMRLKEGSGKTRHDEVGQRSVRAADAPIIKLVSSIITGAIDTRASDIHIEPQVSDIRVRYRVDGILHEALNLPLSALLEVVSHIKITADMDISERRVPQDGHMAVQHNGKGYDLRVSSLPGVGGEKIVMRILDKNVNKWSLDTVVSSPEDNQEFRELVSNPHGMFLLTGPTGSGKTTTLYSILQLLNTPERNIVTVEDPVEYHLDGITQLQVRPVAGMAFASALRSILRQDPDIILVGEIRDVETAEIAISAAQTGHLVLSTLHTNDAVGAIERLINLEVPSFLVASAVLGTAAQRLIRILCPKCKQAYQPSEDELKYLRNKSCDDKKMRLYRGTGCSSCYGTGYHGRKSIYEILCISPEISQMILRGCRGYEIGEHASKEGMKSLCESALDEVINGTTTLDEVRRVIDVGSG